MNTSPLIGITLDFEAFGEYSPMPHYALRQNYFSSVSDQGGIPIALPLASNHINHYIDMIDGLIITGGHFDIPPSHYGEKIQHSSVKTKENRTEFESAITRAMFEKQKPILGICGGEQLLNVIFGGTLIQHIPDEITNPQEHEKKPYTEPAHTVTITPDTLLYRVVGTSSLPTNSSHHQAVKNVAPDMVVNAATDDGVIEGVEHKNHPFCLGVQWHPEYLVTQGDKKIFHAFIAACGA